MRDRFAHDFAPDIVFLYNDGAEIPKGTAIQRQTATVSNIPDPARDDGTITFPVLSITACNAAGSGQEQNFIGVAKETISADSFGPVCVGGPCDALVNTSITMAAGDPLNPGTTLGAFIAASTPYAIVAAHVIEAKTTTAAAATTATFVKVFVESLGLKSGGGSAYS
jgi:hypothetical protein